MTSMAEVVDGLLGRTETPEQRHQREWLTSSLIGEGHVTLLGREGRWSYRMEMLCVGDLVGPCNVFKVTLEELEKIHQAFSDEWYWAWCNELHEFDEEPADDEEPHIHRCLVRFYQRQGRKVRPWPEGAQEWIPRLRGNWSTS